MFPIFSAFTFFWLGIRYELVNSMDLGFKTNWSIVWVITGRWGVSSERMRSSCSSSNSNMMLVEHLKTQRSRLPITYLSVIQSFWYFAQSTAAALPHSVPNLKSIGQLKGCYRRTGFREIWVQDEYGRISYIAQHPAPFVELLWAYLPGLHTAKVRKTYLKFVKIVAMGRICKILILKKVYYWGTSVEN